MGTRPGRGVLSASAAIEARLRRAHNNLGNVLILEGKPDEATACYQRALQLKPGYAEAHNNLGNALRVQGKPDAAVACYQQTLQLKPDYAEGIIILVMSSWVRASRTRRRHAISKRCD